jgi:hypothetical protein
MAGFTFRNVGVVNQLAAPGAGAAIVPAWTATGNGILHITVSVDTSTTVSLKVDDGTTAHELDLNAGAALTTLTAYVFPVPVVSGYIYTLIIKTGATDSTIPHANLMFETPIG